MKKGYGKDDKQTVLSDLSLLLPLMSYDGLCLLHKDSEVPNKEAEKTGGREKERE